MRQRKCQGPVPVTSSTCSTKEAFALELEPGDARSREQNLYDDSRRNPRGSGRPSRHVINSSSLLHFRVSLALDNRITMMNRILVVLVALFASASAFVPASTSAGMLDFRKLEIGWI